MANSKKAFRVQQNDEVQILKLHQGKTVRTHEPRELQTLTSCVR